MKDGRLVYEYNMMIIETYTAETDPIPAGKHRIVIDTKIGKPGGPAEVVITVDGKEAATNDSRAHRPGRLHRNREFRHRRRPRLAGLAGLRRPPPVPFTGKIGQVHVSQ